MKQSLLLLFLLAGFTAGAQQFQVAGTVQDAAGNPLRNVSVSLLEVSDSTMAFFGVSGADGGFEIRGARRGNFLLQAAAPGYSLYYAPVSVPLTAALTPFRLQRPEEGGDSLREVEVRAQKVPVLIKKDTVEYNAGSFRTRPDAPAEDLLRSMPGIEVDKSGNIRAHGKDVEKVLVDGREFFGNDPKVATRNLPADAVDKVQVFDGMSSMAQFTGIDDGTRDRTLNFVLKDGKRKGYFGDAEAGIGTSGRFKAAAHLYSFRKKSQFAVLGMANNINQFGFSVEDYINFNGGLRSLMEGGGGRAEIRLDGNAPVDFGQQITGLVTSGTAGVNYTLEPSAGRRFNISYMGNAAGKRLEEQARSENLTDSAVFIRNDDSRTRSTDWGHHAYYSWRYDLDSTNQLRLNGNAGYSLADARRELLSSSTLRDLLLNRLDSRVLDDARGYDASATLSYVHRMKGSWPVLRTALSGSYNDGLTRSSWNNQSFTPLFTALDAQYQHNHVRSYNGNVTLAATRRLSEQDFLDPELRLGRDVDALDRRQGPAASGEQLVDSLSPSYSRRYQWLRPGLALRHNTEKLQYSLALRGERGWLSSGISNEEEVLLSRRNYLLPSASLRYAPRNSTTYSLYYSTAVTAPGARQMLPATDYTNPLMRLRGNPSLQPEYGHELRADWMRYDQFSFSSVNAGLQGRFTRNKIAYSRSIRPDLSQDVSYINVPRDYSLNGNAEYSTPVRPLGLSVTIGLTEAYQYGQSLVDGIMNQNSTLTHSAKLRIGNRKKDKWDAELNLSADLTDSRYSVQRTLNARFAHYNATAKLSWKPSERFYFSLNGDVDHYTSQSFNGSVTIPLLNASASFYCLKANRGVLSLEGFDLLNRNRAVQRVSQLNYLLEQRSNVLQRYVMISFKYRLTATGNSSPGSGMRL